MPIQSLPVEVLSAVLDVIVDPIEFLHSCGWMGGSILTPFDVPETKITDRWWEVFEKDQKTVLQAMLVCKQWYPIAARSAYRTLVIMRPSQMKQLAHIFDASRGGLSEREVTTRLLEDEFYTSISRLSPEDSFSRTSGLLSASSPGGLGGLVHNIYLWSHAYDQGWPRWGSRFSMDEFLLQYRRFCNRAMLFAVCVPKVKVWANISSVNPQDWLMKPIPIPFFHHSNPHHNLRSLNWPHHTAAINQFSDLGVLCERLEVLRYRWITNPKDPKYFEDRRFKALQFPQLRWLDLEYTFADHFELLGQLELPKLTHLTLRPPIEAWEETSYIGSRNPSRQPDAYYPALHAFLEKHGHKILFLNVPEKPKWAVNSKYAHRDSPMSSARWLDIPTDVLAFCPNVKDLMIKAHWFRHDHCGSVGPYEGPDVSLAQLAGHWSHPTIERIHIGEFGVPGDYKFQAKARDSLQQLVKSTHGYHGPCLTHWTEDCLGKEDYAKSCEGHPPWWDRLMTTEMCQIDRVMIALLGRTNQSASTPGIEQPVGDHAANLESKAATAFSGYPLPRLKQITLVSKPFEDSRSFRDSRDKYPGFYEVRDTIMKRRMENGIGASWDEYCWKERGIKVNFDFNRELYEYTPSRWR